MYSFAKKTVLIIDEIINFLLLIAFVITIIFCAYVFTDGNRITAQADASRYAQYKPLEKEHLTFDGLCEKNPDVFAWISLEDTGVDYPLVQGKDNAQYVNLNPEKEFALSGSIFLDYRNSRDLTDKVNIIYGHHMEKDKMFGCFDKYEDSSYFHEHSNGSIIYNNMTYDLNVFAFLRADGYDTTVYNPLVDGEDFEEWVDMIANRSVITGFLPHKDSRVVLLSTCASASTNQRLLLAAELGEGRGLSDNSSNNIELGLIIIYTLIPVAVAASVLTVVIIWRRKRQKQN